MPGDGVVAVFGRVAVDLETGLGEPEDPVLGNPAARVQAPLDGPVVLQGVVGDLDDEDGRRRVGVQVRAAEVFEPVRARELVRRLEFCYTPKHGSWLNIAENELSALTRQCLRGRRIGDLETLHREVSAWSGDVNGTQRGVDWQMKVNDARCKLKSVYPKIVT